MSSDTETEEMNFTVCAVHTEKIYNILVAGGGLQNGNACAYVEIPFSRPNKIAYVEYTIGGVRVNVEEENDSILVFEKLDEEDYNYDIGEYNGTVFNPFSESKYLPFNGEHWMNTKIINK